MKTTRNTALLINNADHEEVFSIESDGTIHWMENGKLKKVTTEKEIALAFAVALKELAEEYKSIERTTQSK